MGNLGWQFLDHDITFTPEAHQEAEHCCEDNSKANCFAIRIPEKDPFYSQTMIEQVRNSNAKQFPVKNHNFFQTCMEFGRSEQFCAQTGGLREQINGITAFVDASNVYGSDDERARRLRTGEGVG
jgi:hypothetical protein